MSLAKITRLGHWQIASFGCNSMTEINQILADPKLLTEYPHGEIVNIQQLHPTQNWPYADGNQAPKAVNWILSLRWWKTLGKPEDLDLDSEDEGVDNGGEIA